MLSTGTLPALADSDRRQTRLILAGGALLLLFFATFTLLYPLLGLYAEIIPNAIKTKPAWGLIERGVITLDKPLYVIAVVALFLVYLGVLIVAIRRANSSVHGRANDTRLARIVLLVGAVSAVILLWSYPLFSQDVFDYVFHTHEWVRYGASPFTHVPSEFSFDPLYKYVSWTEAPSPYGAIWILLTAPLSWLAGDSLLLNLILFKGLTVVCYAGSAFLLYLALGKVLPRYRLAGTLAFAWNPLVLMEFGGSGHNDIVMIFFAMLALWLVTNGRFALSLAAITASVLIKVVTVFVLPLFILFIVWQTLKQRRASDGSQSEARVTVNSAQRPGFQASMPPLSQARWYGSLLAGLLLSCAVVVFSYAPLWEGINSFAFLRRGDIVGGAPVGNVVTDLIAGMGLGHDAAIGIWKVLSMGSFAALILRQAWVVLRGSSHTISQVPGFKQLNELLSRIVYGKGSSQRGSSADSSVDALEVETGIERLSRASLSLLFFYAVVVSQYYQPWYLSWALIWVGMLLKPRYSVMVWTLFIFCGVAVAGYVYL